MNRVASTFFINQLVEYTTKPTDETRLPPVNVKYCFEKGIYSGDILKRNWTPATKSLFQTARSACLPGGRVQWDKNVENRYKCRYLSAIIECETLAFSQKPLNGFMGPPVCSYPCSSCCRKIDSRNLEFHCATMS